MHHQGLLIQETQEPDLQEHHDVEATAEVVGLLWTISKAVVVLRPDKGGPDQLLKFVEEFCSDSKGLLLLNGGKEVRLNGVIDRDGIC